MLDFVPLLLAVLATFRITSLIVEDTITNPLREFWWRRFPTRGFYYETFRVDRSNEVDNAGTVRAWPFTRLNRQPENEAKGRNKWCAASSSACQRAITSWPSWPALNKFHGPPYGNTWANHGLLPPAGRKCWV